MTRLRSGSKYNFVKRRNAHQHRSRAPAKPNRPPTKKPTRKTKPKGKNTLRDKRRWVQKEYDSSRLSGKATRELHEIYNKKNSGKLQDQRAMARRLTNEAKDAKQRLDEVFGRSLGALVNGVNLIDSADTFREKRRWIQRELEARRVNAKVARELLELFNKRNVGRSQRQRIMAGHLSDAAKEVDQRLEQAYGQNSGARRAARAMGGSLGGGLGDVGEMPRATTLILDGSHTDNDEDDDDDDDDNHIDDVDNDEDEDEDEEEKQPVDGPLAPTNRAPLKPQPQEPRRQKTTSWLDSSSSAQTSSGSSGTRVPSWQSAP